MSVYADLDGRCKRGLAVEYEGRTLFVGNGIARLSRRELFSAEAQNRCTHQNLCISGWKQFCMTGRAIIHSYPVFSCRKPGYAIY